MRNFTQEALVHDPIHGYLPFVSTAPPGETCERDLIDHPWVQRLRQIHQLQTAWYVFPSAEHSRFQHVLGVMHLASRAVAALYDSLKEQCPDVPSRACVESLMRLAGLLHDVGHGPFGHFLDEYFLLSHGLTHETLGAAIIERELGTLLAGIRATPTGRLNDDEAIDPRHVSFLIMRPKGAEMEVAVPRWLVLLRSLFSGIYTVDNMDFVLRDAYMSGFNARAFDLERLLHYSFFGPRGLTIHSRGIPALVRFVTVRAELFRSLYFHRTVRAIDLTLQDLFAESKDHLFPGAPLERLDDYRAFTEWSLLIDVARWPKSDDPAKRALGERWTAFLNRQVRWKRVAETTIFFDPRTGESASVFSRETFFEAALREHLPVELQSLPLRVDIARHVHRPGTRGPASGQNFVYDETRNETRELSDDDLFRQIPVSYRICRVYAESTAHSATISAALHCIQHSAEDDRTNM